MSDVQQEIRADWSALFTWNEDDQGVIHFSCEEYPKPKGRTAIVVFGKAEPADYLNPEEAIEAMKQSLAEALKRTLAGMTFAPADEDDEEDTTMDEVYSTYPFDGEEDW